MQVVKAKERDYEIYRGSDAFRRARSCWRELEARCDASHFQTCALAEAWFEAYGSRAGAVPQILVLREGDETIGLFPGCVARVQGVRVITWLGLPEVLDSGDVLFDSGRSAVTADDFVVEAVTRLKRENRGLPLLLTNVRSDALAFPALSADCFRYSHGVIPEVIADDVPGSFDGRLSRSMQKTLRLKSNRLERDGGYTVEQVDLGMGSDFEPLQRLIELKVAQREAAGLKVEFDEREYFTFLRRQAELGARTQLSTLVFDGQAIAGTCDVERGDRRCLMLAAFDPRFSAYSPGLLLCWQVSRGWLDAAPGRVYSLGWGGDAYKYHWRPTEMPLCGFVGRGPAGIAIAAAIKTRDRATRLLRPGDAARLFGRSSEIGDQASGRRA